VLTGGDACIVPDSLPAAPESSVISVELVTVDMDEQNERKRVKRQGRVYNLSNI
jgi:hypothetical protein